VGFGEWCNFGYNIDMVTWKNLLRRIKQSPFFPYLYLLLIAGLGYGLLIPVLGIYGDEPAFLATYHRFTAKGYQQYLGWFRPYAVWVYELITPVFKETVWAYHAFFLFLRWISACLLYQIVAFLGDRQKNWALPIAALFLLFPGFSQQTVPLEFSLHFFALDAYLFSLLLMFGAIKHEKARLYLTVLSLVFSCQLFIIEYFFGLELLRPFLLVMYYKFGVEKQENWKTNSRKLLRVYFPYFIVLMAYLIWRLFFLETGYYQPLIFESLSASPVTFLWSFIQNIAEDILNVIVLAWVRPYSLAPRGISTAIYLFLAMSTFLFTWWAIFDSVKTDELHTQNWSKWMLGLGALALFTGGIPAWSANLKIALSFPWDRLTLPLMLGSVLLVSMAIALFITPKYRSVVLAFVIAVSAGFQFLNANNFRKEWNNISSTFWQLTWRMPGIAPDTLILTDTSTFSNFYNDNSLNALFNWTYDPSNTSDKYRYKYFDIEARYEQFFPAFSPGIPVSHGGFTGSTSQAIVIFSTPATCLRVLNADDALLPFLTPSVVQSLALSDASYILRSPEQGARPPHIFEEEPPHQWCYFFSKAELSAQEGDWPEVLSLGEEAFSLGFAPTTPSELMVFVKGYALTGNWEQAIELSSQMIAQDPNLSPWLCHQWEVLFSQEQTLSRDVQIPGLNCGNQP